MQIKTFNKLFGIVPVYKKDLTLLQLRHYLDADRVRYLIEQRLNVKIDVVSKDNDGGYIFVTHDMICLSNLILDDLFQEINDNKRILFDMGVRDESDYLSFYMIRLYEYNINWTTEKIKFCLYAEE